MASLTLLILTRFTKNSRKIGWIVQYGAKRSIVCGLIVAILSLTGCISLVRIPPTLDAPFTPEPTPVSAYPWVDAGAVMEGICFEAALDAVGETFVLRNADDHMRFYDLADNSQLCRRPVTRYAFDFSNGRILAGLWSYGRGCTARHEVLSFTRDDAAQSINLQLRFVTEGNCDYELVRAFWISLENATNYQIDVQVDGS
jgi:hypothetical protein